MAAGVAILEKDRIGQQLDLLDAAIDRVAGDLDPHLSDDQILRRIEELGRRINRLAGIRLRAIGEADRRKICEEQHGWTLANHLVNAEPQPLQTARARWP